VSQYSYLGAGQSWKNLQERFTTPFFIQKPQFSVLNLLFVEGRYRCNCQTICLEVERETSVINVSKDVSIWRERSVQRRICPVITMSCEQLIPPRIDRRVRDEGPRTGLRQSHPFEKLTKVSHTRYPRVEDPRCAHYASGVANGDNAECFYSG